MIVENVEFTPAVEVVPGGPPTPPPPTVIV
jgi:hypothetical protein